MESIRRKTEQIQEHIPVSGERSSKEFYYFPGREFDRLPPGQGIVIRRYAQKREARRYEMSDNKKEA